MIELKQRTTALDKLNDTVDWERFRPVLEQRMNDSDQSKGGRPSYDPVFMFKVVVLQKYYGLSEEDTEFQILDRFSFQRFLGLDVSSEVPDKNTVWLFKERLGSNGVKEVFKAFESVLFKLGLTASPGKIVDESIVENAIRPTAIGKKNFLFFGSPDSGQTSAIIYSLIETCRKLDINPAVYLREVLDALPTMKQAGVADWTTACWKANHSAPEV